MSPLAQTLAAVLLATAALCRAAVTVVVTIDKNVANRDARIDRTDAWMKSRLPDSSRGFFTYPEVCKLKYDFPDWAGKREEVQTQLKNWWGKDNVEEIISLMSVTAAARLHPSFPKDSLTHEISGIRSALTAPGKTFDGSGITQNTAHTPVAMPAAPAASTKASALKAATTGKPRPKIQPKAPPPPADPQQQGTISQEKIAQIVFGEGSSLRPLWKDPQGPRAISNYDPASLAQLRQARRAMALIADKRDGRGVAPPIRPRAVDLKNVGTDFSWQEARTAASAAKADASLTKTYLGCRHFVTWPSDDGKTPTKDPSMAGHWPYASFDKIRFAYGPFRNPQRGGDVPAGDNIYTFVFCGVK